MAADSPHDPLVATMLGPCRIEALIGRGGMGRVYKARHLALDRLVAVKLIDASGSGGMDTVPLRALVLAEARTVAKLEDPRIVAIYEVGEERGIPYIVMQWVDGESLEARVSRVGALPLPEALAIVKETAAALGAAHAAGLVHRDVKPGNILIDTHGAVKLTDFGIARAAGVVSAQGEAVAGSFHFMAPEQALGGPPDPRSDLYALGTTWYYALTASPPFPGSALDALMRHRDEMAPEVRVLRPEVTQKAATLLRRLMAKKPEERPADAKTLLAEMSEVGMLLDTDTSGSPFKILPSAPRQETRPVFRPAPGPGGPTPLLFAPFSPEPLPTTAVPMSAIPTPPPVPAAAEPGSKTSFFGLLAALGLVVLAWQWRRAGGEDWATGAAVFATLPAALTFCRATLRRKFVGVVCALSAILCWARFALASAGSASGRWSPPELEAVILAGLSVCALWGSVYLGQWGEDKSEVFWARVLGPLAGLGLLLSALTWTAPENQSWSAALPTQGRAWWTALRNSGGAWRWLGMLGVFFAMGATAHRKAPSP